MKTTLKNMAGVVAIGLPLVAASEVGAYEPNDIVIQLMGQGFISDASGNVAGTTNYDSGNTTINPALNISYFITKNLAVQTVLAVPNAKVDINTDGNSSRLTEQWVLPLSIIPQWHFFSDGPISPYLGVGFTYAWFWENKSHIGPHVEVDDTYGGLVNFGVNFQLPDTRWMITVDAKKWWLKETNAEVGGNRVGDLTVNPWFFGVGVGYRFSL